jgi:hypothetical protein
MKIRMFSIVPKRICCLVVKIHRREVKISVTTKHKAKAHCSEASSHEAHPSETWRNFPPQESILEVKRTETVINGMKGTHFPFEACLIKHRL